MRAKLQNLLIVSGIAAVAGFSGSALAPLVSQSNAQGRERAEAPAPRIAVVDIARVFDEIQETRALREEQEVLLKRTLELKSKIDNLQLEAASIGDIRKKQDKLLEKFRLELQLETVTSVERKQLLNRQLRFVEAFRERAAKSITDYAEAHELSFVLERQLVLDSERGLRSSIVHFARPEFDITKEISLRVNDLYGKR